MGRYIIRTTCEKIAIPKQLHIQTTFRNNGIHPSYRDAYFEPIPRSQEMFRYCCWWTPPGICHPERIGLSVFNVLY